MRRVFIVIMCAGTAVPATAQQTSVVNGPHNLSVSGTGSVRATIEDEICIFCHAPHNSSPVKPLWNRAMPSDAYTIYSSRSLNAQPGQPTGMSKMCLSCHDGTIALGSVISRDMPIAMAGGVTTMPNGPSRLGTDLSDDHPISFRYDNSIPAHDTKIKSPSALPPSIRLDSNSELQCTSCHDAHNNAFGKFLVMRNDNSELCVSCHQVGQTNIDAHMNCNACHQPHTAPSGPYLLKRMTVSDTCTSCHDGTVHGAANIAAEMRKLSAHDTGSPVDPPDPQQDHATCVSCHDPHTMMSGTSPSPKVHPNFGLINGTSSSGAALKTANYEFEVCFNCHADRATGKPFITRVVEEHNTRMEFSSGAISSHPVTRTGSGTSSPSLRPTISPGTQLACTDCHGSDNPEGAGHFAPGGMHGSTFAPSLVARYETADYTNESEQAYALCYSCHDRSSILSDQSFKGHRKHIIDERAPCAACHDAHGISSLAGKPNGNTHLINFASSIVKPAQNGRLEFIDLGTFSGECFLNCHSSEHIGKKYP